MLQVSMLQWVIGKRCRRYNSATLALCLLAVVYYIFSTNHLDQFARCIKNGIKCNAVKLFTVS